MFRLLQLSDCHLFGDRNKKGYAEINPFKSLRRVLDTCADWPADVVMVTGDISGDDSVQSYEHFTALMARYFDCPVYTLPGNHDNNPHYDAVLAEWDLTRMKRVRCGRWWLHGLDTRYHGTLGQIDLRAWQETARAVKDEPEASHLLALHHHPKEVGGWMDKHALHGADVLSNGVSVLPGLKAVMYGHVHLASQQRCEDTMFLSAPSTCWQFASAEDFALENLSPGARKLILHDNGHLETEVVRIENGDHFD